MLSVEAEKAQSLDTLVDSLKNVGVDPKAIVQMYWPELLDIDMRVPKPWAPSMRSAKVGLWVAPICLAELGWAAETTLLRVCLVEENNRAPEMQLLRGRRALVAL